MKQKMLLLGALIFGALAFLLTYAQINMEKAKLRGQSETVYVIALTRDKTAGEELLAGDVTRQAVERIKNSGVGSREIPYAQLGNVIGRRLESTMRRGDTLQYTDLKPINQQHGFTAMIRKEYRAVSIPVDTSSSVSNLVQQNDSVDVIGTFRFPSLKGDASLDTVTMTILQNVKVLAVGNRWGGGYEADPTGQTNRSYGTVTLMLLPHEVEMVVFASQKGRLSLSLRNYNETQILPANPSVDFKRLEKSLPDFNSRREKIQQGLQ